ncbi:hypothetical protein CcaverHIS002_0705780 [Cutaneotrichosporon cavernicola]|uniref:Uncharacterized protein n=1 Tax=Cutaneotrichosporon cavernicola TaxID=279322 RepID=A0AA48LA40_9TREE|nr:uncharacterized protein CcaverHIS019_0705820 [Cutaneotrichosporon cavernicola]BEI87232.1 hypothetical protein CcaverHIS002_0705780 [Cutaneotrichosporon cavernicola]BEI95001.1 hypothetical protein CcaverHIS019_0705820 [Cutaneotrichosporon cavernicola]
MSTFSGSLIGKRKADLVEIAEALGVDDAASKNMVTLREDIQTRLDTDAEKYRTHPQFEGLYRRTRRSHVEANDDSDSPAPEKTPRTRRSLAKVVDHLTEAASVPLPDSPAKVFRSVAQDTTEAFREVADDALALVETDTRNIVARLRDGADEVARVIRPVVHHTEEHWRNARDIFSQADNLLIAAIALEGAALYYRVTKFHHITLTFPPRDTEPGSFGTFFGNAFSWAPTLAWTFVVPRYSHFWQRSDVWPALTWWLGATVLPPLFLSTIVSFVPQKGVNPRRGVTTRYQSANPPTPTVDALTFAIFRFAILLAVLYDAAPFNLTYALNLSGDATLRVLNAGVLFALVLAQRLAA